MNADDFQTISEIINSRLTVPQLKILLRDNGLHQTGRKSVLQDRLQDFINALRANNEIYTLRNILDQCNDLVNSRNSFTAHPGLSAASQAGNASFTAHSQPHQPHQPQPPQQHPTLSSAELQLNLFRADPFYIFRKPLLDRSINCVVCYDGRNMVTRQFVLSPEDSALLREKPESVKILLTCRDFSTREYSTPDNPVPIQFPQHIEVRLNSSVVPDNLRGLKNKPGTAKPANLTPFIRPHPHVNHLEIVYAFSKNVYLMNVFLADSVSVEQLRDSIMAKPHLDMASTLENYKKASEDDDIVATSVVISLKCPLSYCRLEYPCKSVKCRHLQCFDMLSFLMLQQQALTWTCPVCQESIPLNTLRYDDFMAHVLAQTPQEAEAIEIDPSGAWHVKADEATGSPSPGPLKKEFEPSVDLRHRGDSQQPIEVVSLDSSDDEAESEAERVAEKVTEPETEVRTEVRTEPANGIDREVPERAAEPPVRSLSHFERLRNEAEASRHRNHPEASRDLPERYRNVSENRGEISDRYGTPQSLPARPAVPGAVSSGLEPLAAPQESSVASTSASVPASDGTNGVVPVSAIRPSARTPQIFIPRNRPAGLSRMAPGDPRAQRRAALGIVSGRTPMAASEAAGSSGVSETLQEHPSGAQPTYTAPPAPPVASVASETRAPLQPPELLQPAAPSVPAAPAAPPAPPAAASPLQPPQPQAVPPPPEERPAEGPTERHIAGIRPAAAAHSNLANLLDFPLLTEEANSDNDYGLAELDSALFDEIDEASFRDATSTQDEPGNSGNNSNSGAGGSGGAGGAVNSNSGSATTSAGSEAAPLLPAVPSWSQNNLLRRKTPVNVSTSSTPLYSPSRFGSPGPSGDSDKVNHVTRRPSREPETMSDAINTSRIGNMALPRTGLFKLSDSTPASNGSYAGLFGSTPTRSSQASDTGGGMDSSSSTDSPPRLPRFHHRSGAKRQASEVSRNSSIISNDDGGSKRVHSEVIDLTLSDDD